MVDTKLLNQIFEQLPESCVLSSYAIVTNYFCNQMSISDVFDEYCDFFKIPYLSHLDSERASGNHLNRICQDILKWRGYQMVDYIHNHANQHLFTTNRNFFSTLIYSLAPLTIDQYNSLIDNLRANESMANILTAVPAGGYHSRTLGVNQKGMMFIHDTAQNATSRITINPSLVHNTILECILYLRN